MGTNLNWLIWRGAGRRQKKKPMLSAPLYENNRNLPVLYKGGSSFNWRPTGKLDWQDYRYWSGGEYTKYRRCRFCARGAEADNFPNEHKRETNSTCFKALDAAFSLLMKGGRCVSCDTLTTEACWGVPLCFRSRLCYEKWMFMYVTPSSLASAIILAKKQGLIPCNDSN